jgi:hypothetical protein
MIQQIDENLMKEIEEIIKDFLFKNMSYYELQDRIYSFVQNKLIVNSGKKLKDYYNETN